MEQGVPKPAGDTVTLSKVEAARFAVFRFSGSRTADNDKTADETLKGCLAAQKIVGPGNPVFA